MQTITQLPAWRNDDPDATEPLLYNNLTLSDDFLTKFKGGEFDVEDFVSMRISEFADHHKAKDCGESEEL